MEGAPGDLLVLLFLLFDPDLEVVLFLLAIEACHKVFLRVRLPLQDRDGGRVDLWLEGKVPVGLLGPVDPGGLRSLRNIRRRVISDTFIQNGMFLGVRYLVIEPS